MLLRDESRAKHRRSPEVGQGHAFESNESAPVRNEPIQPGSQAAPGSPGTSRSDISRIRSEGRFIQNESRVRAGKITGHSSRNPVWRRRQQICAWRRHPFDSKEAPCRTNPRSQPWYRPKPASTPPWSTRVLVCSRNPSVRTKPRSRRRSPGTSRSLARHPFVSNEYPFGTNQRAQPGRSSNALRSPGNRRDHARSPLVVTSVRS